MKKDRRERGCSKKFVFKNFLIGTHPANRHMAKIKNSSSTEKHELIRDVLINSAEIIRVELVFHCASSRHKSHMGPPGPFTGFFYFYISLWRPVDRWTHESSVTSGDLLCWKNLWNTGGRRMKVILI